MGGSVEPALALANDIEEPGPRKNHDANGDAQAQSVADAGAHYRPPDSNCRRWGHLRLAAREHAKQLAVDNEEEEARLQPAEMLKACD